MKKMMLYGIEPNYLDYLRRFDNKVSLDPTQNRKFIGVLFEVNDLLYCAPLTSPKPKHKTMPDKQPDIYKLDNGNLGLINLNNMIPVNESVIVNIDIKKEPRADYRRLMKKQVIEIRKNADDIKKKALRLYSIINSGKQPKLNKRCCNYLTLEAVAANYLLARVQIAADTEVNKTKLSND